MATVYQSNDGAASNVAADGWRLTKSRRSLPVASFFCITGNQSLFTVCKMRGPFSFPESNQARIVKEAQLDAPSTLSSLSSIGAAFSLLVKGNNILSLTATLLQWDTVITKTLAHEERFKLKYESIFTTPGCFIFLQKYEVEVSITCPTGWRRPIFWLRHFSHDAIFASLKRSFLRQLHSFFSRGQSLSLWPAW